MTSMFVGAESKVGALLLADDGTNLQTSKYVDIKCFLCDHLFVEAEQPWLMFENRVDEDGQLECSLSAILASAIGRELEEANAHSTLLCDDCNSTILEFERLEQRFSELRYRILTAYNQTAHRNNIEPIAIEINGVLQMQDDESGADRIQYVELVEAKEEAFDIIEEDSNCVEAIKVDEVAVEDSQHYEQNSKDPSKYAFAVMKQEEPLSESEAVVMTLPADIEYTVEQEALNEENVQFDGEDIIVYDMMEKSQMACDDNNSSQSNHSHDLLYEADGVDDGVDGVDDGNCTAVNGQNYAGETPKFECETCLRKFSNYRLFRIHKRMHYSSAKQFECSECHKKYSSKNLLDEHMNMHTGVRPFKCPKCPKDFASKYTLQTHMKIHTERQRPFQCDECDKSFLNQQNLTQHKKLHFGIKEFSCDVCSKSFGTQHNLDVHKIVHLGLRPFVCRTCGKGFARRAEIKDHERIHTGEKPFKCDLCPMAFAQRSNLTSHKKSTHLNEKQHKCDQCERSFKRRRLLDYHVQSAHTGERPHKCKVCGAGFVYPEHYKKHMRIHTGHKPFACEVCGKQFNSPDNRNAHRFVHSDKKPYECLECGAGFMRKPLLLAHMKHTNHANDTIIVNQPQISNQHSAMGMLSLSGDDINFMNAIDTIDAEVDEDIDGQCVDESMVNVESLEKMMQRAENILSNEENATENNDDTTSANGQLIKDQVGDVKYLQFEAIDKDGRQTLTWVDIGGDKN